MSAPVDRLAAMIAEHRPEFGDSLGWWECSCRPVSFNDVNHTYARHLAEVIAGAADLAVVEVPELGPDNGHGRRAWSEVFTHDPRRADDLNDSDVIVSVSEGRVDFDGFADGGMFADEAVKAAGGLLAAAKAAEAVDRG